MEILIQNTGQPTGTWDTITLFSIRGKNLKINILIYSFTILNRHTHKQTKMSFGHMLLLFFLPAFLPMNPFFISASIASTSRPPPLSLCLSLCMWFTYPM